LDKLLTNDTAQLNIGGLLARLEIRLGSREKPPSLRCGDPKHNGDGKHGSLPPPEIALVHHRMTSHVSEFLESGCFSCDRIG
jgi:hypothetical protein